MWHSLNCLVFSKQCKNLCWLSLTFIIDWRVALYIVSCLRVSEHTWWKRSSPTIQAENRVERDGIDNVENPGLFCHQKFRHFVGVPRKGHYGWAGNPKYAQFSYQITHTLVNNFGFFSLSALSNQWKILKIEKVKLRSYLTENAWCLTCARIERPTLQHCGRPIRWLTVPRSQAKKNKHTTDNIVVQRHAPSLVNCESIFGVS